MADQLLWGLIGGQGYAANVCAPAIVAADGSVLSGVMSSSRERAEHVAAAHAAQTATDDVDVLLASGIDAVWIASPTYLHHSMATAAIAAGKHVLLEKPLAMTPAEAWALVDSAAAAGVVLATGYQARYVAGHIEAKRQIDSGSLGDIAVARTYWCIHRDGPPQAWRQDPNQAGWGVLGDIGTHHIDLLRMLLGEVSDATGMTAHLLGYGTEDTATATLRFARGTLATVTVCAAAPTGGTRVEVVGTEGAILAINTSPVGGGSVTLAIRDEAPVELDVDPRPSPVAQIETLARVMLGEDVTYCTGADGARNLEILQQIS